MKDLYPHFLVLQNVHAGSDQKHDDFELLEDFTPVAFGFSATSTEVDLTIGDKQSWVGGDFLSDKVPVKSLFGDGSRLVPIPNEALKTYPKGHKFNLYSTDRSAAANTLTVTLYGYKERR